MKKFSNQDRSNHKIDTIKQMAQISISATVGNFSKTMTKFGNLLTITMAWKAMMKALAASK